MSNVAKLKKQAAEYELKKQFDKALLVYVKLLDSYEQNAAELDVALFNRVGDLMLRQGNVADAVDYYEQAVDHYADSGFFNNAIALCSKILRHSPGRASIYYKLGRISAQKGFKSDAKVNFLEYADRMQKAGKTNEAFRALKEFADLCPDQDDIRLMLADQLSKANRPDEAVEQLQMLYARYESEGRTTEAAATADRMRAIDPRAEPRVGTDRMESASHDLIFLDLDDSPRLGKRAPAPPVSGVRPKSTPVSIARIETVDDDLVFQGPRIDHTVLAEPDEDASDVEPVEGLLLGGGNGAEDLDGVPGLETIERRYQSDARETPTSSLIDLEPTSIVIPPSERTTPNDGMSFIMREPELVVPDEDTTGTFASETAASEAPWTDDGQRLASPTPAFTAKATKVAAESVEMLKARLSAEPENWPLHRELAEAMLEAGDRSGGLQELAAAMNGAERAGDLELASGLADEIARLEPEVVRHHQKRVEYAFRTNDRGHLIDAYLSLGDALLRADQSGKARTVYQRVLDLAPDDARARAAVDTIVVPDAEPPAPPRASRISGIEPPRRGTPATPSSATPNGNALGGAIDFVNLGDVLRTEERRKDTRMVVEEKEPSGDEEADFAEMLRKFKQGISENVDAEDYQSHYDLAIAFKEMGLIDEAIAEFQRALAGPDNRLPTFEALGQCFMEKNQFTMAASILARALSERDASEDKLVGVLYLLGRAAEAQGRNDDALGYYQRVFVLDIEFRDIAERISGLEQARR